MVVIGAVAPSDWDTSLFTPLAIASIRLLTGSRAGKCNFSFIANTTPAPLWLQNVSVQKPRLFQPWLDHSETPCLQPHASNLSSMSTVHRYDHSLFLLLSPPPLPLPFYLYLICPLWINKRKNVDHKKSHNVITSARSARHEISFPFIEDNDRKNCVWSNGHRDPKYFRTSNGRRQRGEDKTENSLHRHRQLAAATYEQQRWVAGQPSSIYERITKQDANRRHDVYWPKHFHIKLTNNVWLIHWQIVIISSGGGDGGSQSIHWTLSAIDWWITSEMKIIDGGGTLWIATKWMLG